MPQWLAATYISDDTQMLAAKSDERWLTLLNEWIESDVTLEELVVHVLVHEVGHHFGLSDADMEALENAVGG